MTGKQRRRLNYLKATKKQRRAKWLMNEAIRLTMEALFRYGTEPFNGNGQVKTTEGIIPFITRTNQEGTNNGS